MNWNRILPEKLKKEFLPTRYLAELCLAALILFSICGTAVFLIDPYAYFHKAPGMEQYFDNAYAMIPGVLSQYEYDTVLFGSSMCQNFKISQINEILSCRAVKATAPGISADAFSQFFQKAQQAGKERFRYAIIGLDIFTFAKSCGPWKEYAYLYGDKLFPPEYLFSTDTFHACWECVRKNIRYWCNRKKKDPKMDFNMMFFYREKPENYGTGPLEKNVKSKLNNPPPAGKSVRENLERYLFSHIRKNPQIRFEIFLPPYHTYFWCTLSDQNKLDSYLQIRHHIADVLSEYSNVRLHDFQAETSIVTDSGLYKDVTHYKSEVNIQLLKKIRDCAAPGSPESVRKNSETIKKLVKKSMKKFSLIQNGSDR